LNTGTKNPAMKLQILKDKAGNQTGVYIPVEEWESIKSAYPDIENLDQELPQWEKDLIDRRLDAIRNNPERLRPIEELLTELNRKI
jgi:hypothetical protein